MIIIHFLAGLLQVFKQLKLILLISTISITLGFLGYHKYLPFIAETLWFQLKEKPHLPLGISFFSFQLIAYQIDLYYDRIKAERNIFDFGLYVAFFPQLIAGPIVRYQSVIKQIKYPRFNVALFNLGIQRFVLGLFKKVVIADTIGLISDQIFALPPESLWRSIGFLGALCFAFQIYYDFSGYSDMAIGMGRMMGFKFPENFSKPYGAFSIQDFWRKWHITLSTWFRDYLYIPLGGNKKKRSRMFFNLLVVFTITGLWHGAGWNFIVWGLLNGLFIVLEITFNYKGLKIPILLKWGLTFVLVLHLWVLFRANSLEHASYFLQGMYAAKGHSLESFSKYMNTRNAAHLIVAIVMCLSFERLKIQLFKKVASFRLNVLLRTIGITAYIALFILSVTYLCTSTTQTFIYFRF